MWLLWMVEGFKSQLAGILHLRIQHGNAAVDQVCMYVCGCYMGECVVQATTIRYTDPQNENAGVDEACMWLSWGGEWFAGRMEAFQKLVKSQYKKCRCLVIDLSYLPDGSHLVALVEGAPLFPALDVIQVPLPEGR